MKLYGIEDIGDFGEVRSCDFCDTTQGPFYFYQPDNDITTYVACEDCADEIKEDDDE
jgi:hypothetical protein